MPIDHAVALENDPGAFIAGHRIALNSIAQNLPHGIPALNNIRCRFTLSQASQQGQPQPNTLPMLRMLPGQFGNGLTAMSGWYVRAGDGGMHVDNIPYVDVRITPWPADPKFVFTVGMNGCSLIVASAVPGTAPPLAPWHYRILHDHSHYSLAHWRNAGYRVRFAAYAGADEPGPIPLTFFPDIRVRNYNPHDYAWGYVAPVVNMAPTRVVTNFFHHDGNSWNYHSVHYHTAGANVADVDAPPGTVHPLSSTQSLVM